MADALDQETIRLMDKAGEAMLRPMLEPIRSIYLDSDFLYNYRLGALILKVKNQDEYNYILSRLKLYEEGPNPKITTYFPDLKITEQELDLLEEDPVFEKYLHVASPSTEMLMDLPSIVLRINTYNSTKMDPTPLVLYINQRKHIMPKVIADRLVASIAEVDSKAKVVFTNYPTWSDIPEDLFKQLKHLYVYDLIDFCRMGTVSANAMRDRKVTDKTVIANFVTEDGFKDEDEWKDAIAKFGAVMSALFHSFQFTRKTVLIEKR